ncbi:MAG TPA: lipoyl(octanoyl) transferase LipB [Gammaproteobacteria bacterium]|nr:lipoyl(octanoyl) transferase LipB [Gammaproteobacteria bacterium]
MPLPLTVRHLSLQDYLPVWRAMQAFTKQRSATTGDELWLVEHPPVFTLGLNGKSEHVLDAGDIPVIRIDRGGQVTYHGPGQLVAYPLLDVRRLKLGVRPLVNALERSVIALLADYGVAARARPDAPGVYVGSAKIAALGLRLRRGCCYHGLSLNIDMDLSPFERINPCGFQNMPVTQLRAVAEIPSMAAVQDGLMAHFCTQLGYTAQAGAALPPDLELSKRESNRVTAPQT